MAVAIGRNNQANSADPDSQNYCQPGVQATSDDATWLEISGFKRSITFYKREGGQWCYYCQFSMTSDTASYEPTVRTLLDNDDICAGRTSSSTHPTTYLASLPAADAVFEAAYLASQGGDLIRSTQRACANMRTQPSMSTACIALSTEGSAATATSYFPVSVRRTHDHWMCTPHVHAQRMCMHSACACACACTCPGLLHARVLRDANPDPDLALP